MEITVTSFNVYALKASPKNGMNEDETKENGIRAIQTRP